MTFTVLQTSSQFMKTGDTRRKIYHVDVDFKNYLCFFYEDSRLLPY